MIGIFVFGSFGSFVKTNALGSATTIVNLLVKNSLCTSVFKAYPEKRIPRIGNWSTDIISDVYVVNGSKLATGTATSDSQGIYTIDYCALGYTLFPGNYDFYVKGFSHLEKKFANTPAFDVDGPSITDFTTGSRQLFAGETSMVFDNKINSLDLSTQIRLLYSADIKNDLNRDTKVNSLDLSNTVWNLYMLGDCSPFDPLKNLTPAKKACNP